MTHLGGTGYYGVLGGEGATNSLIIHYGDTGSEYQTDRSGTAGGRAYQVECSCGRTTTPYAFGAFGKVPAVRSYDDKTMHYSLILRQ